MVVVAAAAAGGVVVDIDLVFVSIRITMSVVLQYY